MTSLPALGSKCQYILKHITYFKPIKTSDKNINKSQISTLNIFKQLQPSSFKAVILFYLNFPQEHGRLLFFMPKRASALIGLGGLVDAQKESPSKKWLFSPLGTFCLMDLDTVVITRGYRSFKRGIGISAFSAHTVSMPNVFIHNYEIFSLFSTWGHSHAFSCWL